MKELFDRLSSPISGAFLISWLGWNWNLLVYFLDDKLSASEKIFHISVHSSWYQSLLFPLGTSIAYMVLMPLLLIPHKVYSDWVRKGNEKREAQVIARIEVLKRLNHKDHLELIDTLISNVAKNTKSMDDYARLIETSLNSTQATHAKLTEITRINHNYSETLRKMRDEFSYSQEILKQLKSNSQPNTTELLRDLASMFSRIGH